ncbi:DUF2730 family protein [Algiphilus sp.]|uniref:DUF2730 family protein n=1 Tax=Algiphilus sp. TaxID=1872431 RepID=UPI0025C27AE3|nr:DUF2730 family protein [Algiphilus sp.]MCK5772007.1 hypothetical protein [Algiphilus sp.]
MNVDWDLARFAWGVGVTIVTAAATAILSVWAWVRKRHATSSSEIERVEYEARERDQARKADHELHERRILLLEQQLRFAPTADDLKQLRETMSELSGQLRHQEALTGQINQTVNRINQYLLERGDKR